MRDAIGLLVFMALLIGCALAARSVILPPSYHCPPQCPAGSGR
jgi:hypothetical protein